MKPVIGILTRNIDMNGKSQICISEDYRLAIIKAGGVPILLMPTNDVNYGHTKPKDAKRLTEEEKKDFLSLVKKCDGIVLPGGTMWYDYDEIACSYALEHDIPLLGICLGMQILGNVDNFFKEERVEKTFRNKLSIHYQEENMYAHPIKITGNVLKEILEKEDCLVNSRHNYHIIKKDYFEVDAISLDGQIESLHIPGKKFALGVQWHPENMIEEDQDMLKIFKRFIEKAKE